MPKEIAQCDREFLVRTVEYMVDQGVRQFVDLGCGLPIWGNVHETAQALAPETTVVYVDYELAVTERYREVLAENPRAEMIHADIRIPNSVYDDKDGIFTRLINPHEPVGLLFFAVLEWVHDTPYEIVNEYAKLLASGSYLAICHGSNEGMIYAPHYEILPTFAAAWKANVIDSYVLRNFRQIEKFFESANMPLVPPGVKAADVWGRKADYHSMHSDQARWVMLGGVGRKP